MEFMPIKLLLAFLLTLTTGAVVNHPRVTEDIAENSKENIRNIRNSDKQQNQYHSVFNPTPFIFQTAQQQDYLKQRYAEQQKINVEETAKLRQNPLSKNIQNIYQLSTLEHNKTSEPYDWQPFISTKQTRSSKEYIPLLVKNRKAKRESKDKQDIDRKDTLTSADMSSHIIYVDPQILRRVFELKNKRKQVQSRSIVIDPTTETDSNSLNDLINKNPQIQLESFKRILQDPRQRNKIFPVIEGAQPFQQKDYIPIKEKIIDISNPKTKPNIQVNHGESHNLVDNIKEANDHSLGSIIPQEGQVISREVFDQIQKKLEDSSKFQVHDALIRAQQAAQAHVEAQHKAIEQAQRAILENVQKHLQNVSPEAFRLVQEQITQNPMKDEPQALKLIQENIPQYVTQSKRLLNQPLYSTSLPERNIAPTHAVTIPTSNVNIHSVKTTASPYYVSNKISPEIKSFHAQNEISKQPHLQHFKIIKVTPGSTQVPKQYYVQPQLNEVSQKPINKFSSEYIRDAPEKEFLSATQNEVSEQPQSQNFKIIKVFSDNSQLPKQFLIHPQANRNTVSDKLKGKLAATKNIEYYASDHLNQAVAQLQADRVLLEQVQNNAIINGKKGVNRYVGQKSLSFSPSEDKVPNKDARSPTKISQHLALKTKEKQRSKQNHDSQEWESDDYDDYQYAAKYAFGYRIKDNKEGNDFGHEEKRNGRSAEGSYQVLLPDGRRQKVNYYADDSGYHAKVTYENEANHT